MLTLSGIHIKLNPLCLKKALSPNRVGDLYHFGLGEGKSYVVMDKHAWPDRTTPHQNAWSMARVAWWLSVSDLFIIFFEQPKSVVWILVLFFSSRKLMRTESTLALLRTHHHHFLPKKASCKHWLTMLIINMMYIPQVRIAVMLCILYIVLI